MEARKFAIGDQVCLLLSNYANGNLVDVYTISRGLPAMANVWQYRVKRVGDGQERAVSEQQLTKAGSQTLTNLLPRKRSKVHREFVTPAPLREHE